MPKKIARYSLLLLLVFATTSANKFHKYYLSVTEVEYKEEKQSLQIISRIFVDDMERLLQTRYDKSISLIEGNESENADQYLQKYIAEKLQVKINQKQLQLKYIGKRYEDNLIICYFEGVNVKNFTKATVTNQLLTDLYSDQKNLLHFTKNGDTQSVMMVKDNDVKNLSF